MICCFMFLKIFKQHMNNRNRIALFTYELGSAVIAKFNDGYYYHGVVEEMQARRNWDA